MLPGSWWDEWRGSLDGRPTIYVKHLFCRRGWHIDLHKIVRDDDADCFHTHPAWAFRLILWGGYEEEIEGGFRRRWYPLQCGFVAPWLSHRINALARGFSLSLWIRAPKRYPVQLRGRGWLGQEQTHRAVNTIITADAE